MLQSLRLLFHPFARKRRKNGLLCRTHRQNIHQERTAHIYAAPAYCAAVHIFRLAAYPRMRSARIFA